MLRTFLQQPENLRCDTFLSVIVTKRKHGEKIRTEGSQFGVFRASWHQAARCHSSMTTKQVFPLPLKTPKTGIFPVATHHLRPPKREARPIPKIGAWTCALTRSTRRMPRKNYFAVAGEGDPMPDPTRWHVWHQMPRKPLVLPAIMQQCRMLVA